MLPISTTDPVRFTPPALEGREDAPVFILKVPSMREKIALDAAIAAEGVAYPTDTELVQVLRDAVAAHVVQTDWPYLLELIEELEALAEDGKRADGDLAERIGRMVEKLRPYHRPLAELEAERGRFLATAMLVRAEMLLVGIEERGAVTELPRFRGRLTEAAGNSIDTRWGSGTLLTIGVRTVALTSPSEEDAKNSASPPQSPADPAISTAAQ